ncbi:type III-B CRISPR module RAMP protein Cmr1 [Rubeoparvulum massiliense]|uniref:type III-B CRISPR module RAMP protein Cmr1 n=1 Tax=Rubeoparvulum massiliense TaxID=1631346 RepID=UPI00065E98FC|nr:type III-B CRISPR module RAMP protein Cmr1 [Rubeoparvulum massiliense]
MEELKVTFQIITPMFLSGADQEKAEFRLASLKGALRYWYRSIDPSYNHPVSSSSSISKESWIFGGAKQGEGQSRFLMRMESHHQMNVVSNKQDNSKYHKPTYFAFFLKTKVETAPMKKDYVPRLCLVPNRTVTVYFFRRTSNKVCDPIEEWKALLSSIWLLGHLGGLGSRSRRGFGTLALKSWGFTNDSSANQLLKQLPIANNESSIKAWKNHFLASLNSIKSWFGEWQDICEHSIINHKTSFYCREQKYNSWNEALDDVAKVIQDFRKKNKDHRFALGMPLKIKEKMKKSKSSKPKEIVYTPFDGERYASPVWIRIIEIKGKYYPFIAVLTPPKKIAIAEQEEGKKETKTMFKHDFSMHDALNKFCIYLNDYGDKGWKRCE